jgi:hypothetical protein
MGHATICVSPLIVATELLNATTILSVPFPIIIPLYRPLKASLAASGNCEVKLVITQVTSCPRSATPGIFGWDLELACVHHLYYHFLSVYGARGKGKSFFNQPKQIEKSNGGTY